MSAIIILIILVYLVVLAYNKITKRCSKCGKFGSLKKMSSVLIDSKPTKIKETLKRYNKKGEVTSRREVLVNATKKTYQNIYLCSNCGRETIKLTSTTLKN